MQEIKLGDKAHLNEKMTKKNSHILMREMRYKYGIKYEDILSDFFGDTFFYLLDKIYNKEENIVENLGALKDFLLSIKSELNKYIVKTNGDKLEYVTTLGHIFYYQVDDIEMLKYIISLGYDYNLKDSNSQSIKDEIDGLKSLLNSIDEVYKARVILGTFDEVTEDKFVEYEIK